MPSYNTPGEINPGITPGIWETLRGPFQLPSSDYNQAMAELDAREANPRSGIPDDQFEQLTLERALANQMSPFNVGVALGVDAVTEPRGYGRNTQYLGLNKPSYVKAGSTVLQRDPMTGQLGVAFQPKAGMSALQKAKLQNIQNQLKVEYAAFAKEDSPIRKGEHARTINGLQHQLEVMAAADEAVAAPAAQSWMIDPNTIPSGSPMNTQFPQSMEEVAVLDMFGKPGARTPFVFSGATNAPAVAAPRRRRYNPSTGRFE